MTQLTAMDLEIEDAIANGDDRVAELRARGETTAGQVANELERMVRALRLAVVADVDPKLLSRLHLRLETALRRADYLLSEREDIPASQRPTLPPGLGDDPEEILQDRDRPTFRPPAQRFQSDVVPSVGNTSRTPSSHAGLRATTPPGGLRGTG
ncbi:MAG: hypothetical protein U0271_40535 [Polyangiaceae bacterium]